MDLDRFAVAEILNRYLMVVDSHALEPWVALFTDDGVFDNAPELVAGAMALREFIEGWHGSGITRSIHHFMGSYSVEVDGNRATARSTYMAVEIMGAPAVVATGTFEDELRKVDSEWRFARRVHRLDPSFFAAQQKD